jgi:hypothetical protein
MTDLVVLKTEIRKPNASNENWTFPVMLSYRASAEKRYPTVDGVEFANIFKSATGRFPNHELGANGEFQDLLQNWDRFEEKLVPVLLRRVGN